MNKHTKRQTDQQATRPAIKQTNKASDQQTKKWTNLLNSRPPSHFGQKIIGLGTNIQPHKRTSHPADKWIHKALEQQRNKTPSRSTEQKSNRPTDLHTNGPTNQQANRPTYHQTNRPTRQKANRQTDQQINR